MNVNYAREQRQLQLMLQSIDAYINKQISLASLVSNLEFLLNSLEQSSEEWKGTFSAAWASLEFVFADSLDRNIEPSDAQYADIISNSLTELRELIEKQLPRSEER